MKLTDFYNPKLLICAALTMLLIGGVSNGVEILSPAGIGFPDADFDHDGLTNAVEAQIGSYPWNPYSDGDLLKDGEDAVPLNGTMKVPAAPETNYAMIDLGEVATVGTPVGVNSSGAVLLNKEDKELRIWSQGTTSLIMSKQNARDTWPLRYWFVAGPLEDGSVYYAGDYSSNSYTIPWPVDEDFEVNISAQGTNLMKWTPQGSSTTGKVSEFFSYTIPHVESGGAMAGPATPNETSTVLDQTLQTALNDEYDFARLAFESYMDILFTERTFNNADSASGAVILGINDAHQYISYASSSSAIAQPGWFEEQERMLFAGCSAAVCGTGAKSVSYGSADYLYVPGTYYPEPTGFVQIGAVNGVHVNADGFALYSGPHDLESGDDYENLEISAGVNSDIPNCGMIVDMNRSTTPEGPYFFGSDESAVPKLWCVGGSYANIELGYSISNLPETRLIGRRISNRLEIPMKDKLWRNSRVRDVAELCGNPFQWAGLSATQISPNNGFMVATAFKVKNDNGISLSPQDVKKHGFLLIPMDVSFEKKGDNVEISDNINPVTGEWMPDQGKKIFPEAKTPSDHEATRGHVCVKVKTGAPAGWKVRLKIFDVDDPTPRDKDPQYIIDSNDRKVERGDDNRKRFPGLTGALFVGSFAVTLDCTIDAQGVAKFDGELPTLTMPNQPGDNIRVAAILLKPDGTPLSGQNIDTLQVSDKTQPGYVPSGNSVPNGFMGGISPMLTTWRTLHIEVDQMQMWNGNKPSPDRTTAQGLSWEADDPAHPRFISTLTLSTELPEAADFYVDGRIVSGNTTLEIQSNTATTITIKHPSGSTPLTQAQKDAFLAGPFEVFDDDDSGLSGPPLPRSNLINNQVKRAYVPAYVQIEEVDANLNPNSTIPFEENNSIFDQFTNLDSMQDMEGADRTEYWYHLLVISYQPGTTMDGDPAVGTILSGVTGVAFAFGQYRINDHMSIVFVEAIRDLEHSHRRESDFNDYIQERIEKVTAHELAHPPGGYAGPLYHDEGGLMGEPATDENFSPKTLRRIRGTELWNP